VAIWRAATHGLGLLKPSWPDDYLTIQLLRRERHDLVDKKATVQCQIREVLHAAIPGYAECFCHLWDDSPAPMLLARHTASAARQARRKSEATEILHNPHDSVCGRTRAALGGCRRAALSDMPVW
jgi:hypothetical protein